ncbi:beta/gamma crystallin-related protein [Chengkuizengella marina]|uniref:Beta/gamma crystallin 'Greek key' domain-containing protein n=1 Tax=Chengkuizengella marina TaxID=2507566 RepID=A0A6N9Q8K8_9BACL|nr:beta/gamma crystallin-related protein [Chengkuizengella marina]NBI31208.1 hypothetical protein [Chengkuizengella marina]
MFVFKRGNLSNILICVMFLSILIIISLFAAAEVNAAHEGYIMIDRGTYKVYIPEETAAVETANNKDLSEPSAGYLEPPLEIPGLTINQPHPIDTYENRTIFEGIAPVDYIPVNFNVVRDDPYFYEVDYYQELAGQSISILNDALNDYDPGVDTFIGVYNPETGLFSSVFPQGTPEQVTLLLNKHSYFAQGLTLDVEEWWKRAGHGISRDGTPIDTTVSWQYGLSTTQEDTATLTHGIGAQSSFTIEQAPAGVGWSAGVTLSYNFSRTDSYAFSRTINTVDIFSETFNFGPATGRAPFRWAVYHIVTQTKVNYSDAHNFSELDDAIDDLDEYGLEADMNSYIIKVDTKTYSVSEIPIYDVDSSLEVPQNLRAKSNFQDLTITLNWDSVRDPNVEGFLVYKNDNIAQVITDSSRTSWIDVNVEPEVGNVYWIKSYRNDDEEIDARLQHKIVSLPSNTITEEVALTAATFRNLAVGCDIPIALMDSQTPTGERMYYTLYIGDPASGGIDMGSFIGTDASINISPALYDVLLAHPNADFYVVKKTRYNDRLIESPATRIPNNFSVSETAFLYSSTGFNGDCVTVSTNFSDLSSITFNDDLSSMLVQGEVFVSLFPEINYGGFAQTFFTEEDGFAHVRDFDEKIIGADTVSSIKVEEKLTGVYFFTGAEYSGNLHHLDTRNEAGFEEQLVRINYGKVQMARLPDDDISSVKVVGNYAVALYENINFEGNYSLIKEDWGDFDLSDVGDNRTSSFRLFSGRGVWFFRDFDYSGDYAVYGEMNCGYIENCDGYPMNTFPNDKLSSVLTIGDFGVVLYQHADYEGRFQAIRHRDINVGSHSSNLGDNRASSFIIFGKGVHLMDDSNYTTQGGHVKINSPGEYSSTDLIDFQDNTLSSIFVVGFKATVYEDPVFRGDSEEFIDEPGGTRYDPDFSDNIIGDNKASSIKVEER